MSQTDRLALLGGTPVIAEPLAATDWPPVSEAAADRLRELYLSRQWSFNCPAEQAFAQDYARAHSAAHGVYMVNGTVTLECALAALGVGKGDEVIVPGLTWFATAIVANYLGATPVFVDIEPTTLCLDPTKIEAAITPRTRAIIPVHLYAGMADMEAIMAIAARHGLHVIEDCAHMQGGQWAGRGVGSIGQVGSFSFQQSKTMASGEGGICITSDENLANRIFRLKHIGYFPGDAQGKASDPPSPDLLCHNYRGTGFQAVILHDQLKELPARIQRYDRRLKQLEAWLADVPGVRLQSRGRLATLQGAYAVPFIFDGELTGRIPTRALTDALAAEGFAMGLTYGPVYRHRLYNLDPSRYRIAEGGCPVADSIGTHSTVQFAHHWLGAPESSLQKIAAVLRKVALNAEALAAYEPATV